ncbi:MAG: S16 family serine protease, partial [Bacteroidota bacterium]|nr:S16 family serine protease [Bacteroidota bacterium]
IIMCAENERDIKEINEDYLKGLTFHYVNDMSEVLDIALTNEKVKRAKQL